MGNSSYPVSSSDGSSAAASSSYPFYVELESGEGLMLGQHVYVEPDLGTGAEEGGNLAGRVHDRSEGIRSRLLCGRTTEKGRLEKRAVELGNYDENLLEYQILSGLEWTDAIAFPEEGLEEGRETEVIG